MKTTVTRVSARLAPAWALALSVLFSPQPSFPAEGTAPTFGYRVVNVFPHDRGAFTQGLAWDGGTLLESTGLYGSSSLRRVQLETGNVLKSRPLGKKLFGEGAAVAGDRVIQLTWRSGKGLIYDRESLDLLSTFVVRGEGWGIAWDGNQLVMSDGSDTLRFLDPESFGETRRMRVSDGSAPVTNLNELEYIQGKIWANRYYTDEIVIIDPETGKVEGRIDLKGILKATDRKPNTDVLNGIAWDSEENRLFVTGKRWPKLFEIRTIAR